MAAALPALYAILDFDLTIARGHTPERLAAGWLEAGVRLFQLRAKSLPSGQFLELAERLAALAREAGAIFIVNDRVDVARLAGASGVHVGQQDLSPVDARRVLPSPAAIGLSTHTAAQIRAALDQPVDLAYIAFGPVFETRSKERPDPIVGLEGVRLARATIPATIPGFSRNPVSSAQYPLVAIGGITIERAAAVLDAGATSVAVIADLIDDQPERRARAFLRELGSGRVI